MSDALLKLFKESEDNSSSINEKPEIRKSVSQTRINFADLVTKVGTAGNHVYLCIIKFRS